MSLNNNTHTHTPQVQLQPKSVGFLACFQHVSCSTAESALNSAELSHSTRFCSQTLLYFMSNLTYGGCCLLMNQRAKVTPKP